MRFVDLISLLIALVLTGVVVAVLHVRYQQGRQSKPSDPDRANTTRSIAPASLSGSEPMPDPKSGHPDPNELVNLIGGEIVNSRRLQDLDWRLVTIVFDVGEGSVENSGFAYSENSVVPTIASGSMVGDYVRALRDALRVPGKEPFIQMLVQIRRSDGKIKVDFEYDDRSRWRIWPNNLAEMRETLRPQFAD